MSDKLASLRLEEGARCELCGRNIGYGEPYSHYYHGVVCGAHEFPSFRNGALSSEATALCRLQKRAAELTRQLDEFYEHSEKIEMVFEILEELTERDIVPSEVKHAFELLKPFAGKLQELVEEREHKKKWQIEE